MDRQAQDVAHMSQRPWAPAGAKNDKSLFLLMVNQSLNHFPQGPIRKRAQRACV
jgi:hypothetical protein